MANNLHFLVFLGVPRPFYGPAFSGRCLCCVVSYRCDVQSKKTVGEIISFCCRNINIKITFKTTLLQSPERITTDFSTKFSINSFIHCCCLKYTI